MEVSRRLRPGRAGNNGIFHSFVGAARVAVADTVIPAAIEGIREAERAYREAAVACRPGGDHSRWHAVYTARQAAERVRREAEERVYKRLRASAPRAAGDEGDAE